MEAYLAHITDDRTQTVAEHLHGTAERCAAFADAFGSGDQGRLAGMAHDLGKYSDAFQRRLNGGPRVDHATAGAFECCKVNQLLAAFAVAGHHSGLPDGGSQSDTSVTFLGRMGQAQRGKLPDYARWQEEIQLPPAAIPPHLRRGDDPLSITFFTRMLFSCLVDADFLDTEAFMNGQPRPENRTSMEALWERLQGHISGWFPPKGELNACRCAILEQCIRAGEGMAPGLFTLTVPTGGGKTVASLAFALVQARARGLRRVIYVIPYTSIIEQTAQTFREILGPENVLEHHSNVLYDLGEEASEKTVRLAQATENWDMPVVVTTAVQFFESLYAARPAQCRKLHNLARSVIIFDEAQMLPINYLRPCVHAIAQLVAHYGASAVLCTATQPALAPIFREFLPGVSPTEICPAQLCPPGIFRRVTFQQAGKLTWAELGDRLQAREQVLCIVNSRKNAQEVFSRLIGDGNFHLSTLMFPEHRRRQLREIRQRLAEGLPCRVVSTSLIEAGVDVDFPAVYREEAGLDSILQAAGRCNREGRRPAAESVVTVFQGENPPPPLFSTAIGAGKTVLEGYEDISSREAVHAYFHELLDLKGPEAQDSHHILPTIRQKLCPFRTVAEEFHLIENNTRTIYIPLGEGAELTRYLLQDGALSRSLFRRLSRYGVSVYAEHFAALEQAGDLAVLEDGSAVLINPTLYSGQTGLSLTADNGKGLFI